MSPFKKKCRVALRSLSFVLIFIFTVSSIISPRLTQAQSAFSLPAPGVMVSPSQPFVPLLLKGMRVDPDQPLRFEFIVDSGYEKLNAQELRAKSEQLIKYFLASLTIPEGDLWVNLSPFESERILPEELSQTELGRDMLAQDYLLKQLTASLMHPEEELGSQFWKKIRRKAYEKYGTTDIPVDTFHKVWIVPDQAVVFEKDHTVYVVESRMKVMLEQDYVALEQSRKDSKLNVGRWELNVHASDNQKVLNIQHSTFKKE